MRNVINLYISDTTSFEKIEDFILYCGYDYCLKNNEVSKILKLKKNNNKYIFNEDLFCGFDQIKDILVCAICDEEIGISFIDEKTAIRYFEKGEFEIDNHKVLKENKTIANISKIHIRNKYDCFIGSKNRCNVLTIEL